MKLWELLFVRLAAYVVFVLLLLGAWRIVNAQEACRVVGTQIICMPIPTVPSNPGPGFDPSVISRVPDGLTLSPEAIRYIAIRRCIKQSQSWGLSEKEIRDRCFR